MNRAEETRVGIETRAKSLRLRESGMFRAVHAPESVPANDSGEGGDAAAERMVSARLRSPERTAVRAATSAIVDSAVASRGLSNPEVGATINEGRETVRRIRAGALPLTADHLLRIARRRPELFEDIVGMMRGEK